MSDTTTAGAVKKHQEYYVRLVGGVPGIYEPCEPGGQDSRLEPGKPITLHVGDIIPTDSGRVVHQSPSGLVHTRVLDPGEIVHLVPRRGKR